jgi:hypothetical protein
VGRFLSTVHVDPGRINSLVKGGYALGVQGIIIASSVLALIMRRRFNLSLDFVALAPIAVTLLVVQVLFPVIDYGLLRMLQQDMVFLALPIALTLRQMGLWLRLSARAAELVIVTAFAAAFLFLSGAFTAVTGDGPTQLALGNSGTYYDNYYTTASDVAAYSWLKATYPAGYPIDSDRFTRTKIMANAQITTKDALLPGTISRNSYVVLSNMNVTRQQVSFYYNGELLTYDFPLEFLSNNKNLLYSSSDNRVYR